VNLSPYDPARPPFGAGETVRLRAASEWGAGGCPRPVWCVYAEVGGGARAMSWIADLDALAGGEVELAAPPPSDRTRLPCVRVGPGHLVAVHPDWLERVPGAPPTPACTCPTVSLWNLGCRCGAIARGLHV
jgi:hypothetical protein